MNEARRGTPQQFYTLGKQLGSGSFGVVHKARDTERRSVVAFCGVRQLRQMSAHGASERESKALARVRAERTEGGSERDRKSNLFSRDSIQIRWKVRNAQHKRK